MKAHVGVDQLDSHLRQTQKITDLAVTWGYKKCPLNEPIKPVCTEYSALCTNTHISRAIYLYASLDCTTFTGEGVEDCGDEHISITIGFSDVPAIPLPITHVFQAIWKHTAPPLAQPKKA